MQRPARIGNSSQAVPHLARVAANLKYQLAAGVASIPVTRPRPIPPHPSPQGSSPGRSESCIQGPSTARCSSVGGRR